MVDDVTVSLVWRGICYNNLIIILLRLKLFFFIFIITFFYQRKVCVFFPFYTKNSNFTKQISSRFTKTNPIFLDKYGNMMIMLVIEGWVCLYAFYAIWSKTSTSRDTCPKNIFFYIHFLWSWITLNWCTYVFPENEEFLFIRNDFSKAFDLV